MTFIGHERELQSLNIAKVASQGGAVLLTGPSGIGKTLIASSIAQRALCQAAPAGDSGCGACLSCRQFASGNHPDFYRLSPEKSRKKISVEQIRDLSGWECLTPTYSKSKVILIASAEALSLSSQNALLKMIEEPSRSNLFLLVSHSPDLLPTILSRCHQVFLRPLTAQNLLDISRAQGLPKPATKELALSFGSARTLASLRLFDVSHFIETLLNHLSHAEVIDVCQLAQSLLDHYSRLRDEVDKERQDTFFTEEEYVQWIFKLFETLVDDGTRALESLPCLVFLGFERELKILLSSTTPDHRLNFLREVKNCRNDLELNFSSLVIFESLLHIFLSERFVQKV